MAVNDMDLAPYYDGHSDAKIQQDLSDPYLLAQFKRALYSTTIRPALGYLGDGVNTIQDKIEDVLVEGKVEQTIKRWVEDDISTREAEAFLQGRAQLRDDRDAFYASMSEKRQIGALLGDDLYEEAMYGMAMTTVLVDTDLAAQCTWLGQFLVTPSDTMMTDDTKIFVDMFMYTPSASEKSAKAMAEGPGADMMDCMWDWCEHFQVSRMLRLAFKVSGINRLWYQMSSDGGSSEAAVLTLEISSDIETSTRRVNCKTLAKNDWRKIAGVLSENAVSATSRIITLGGTCAQVNRLIAVLLLLNPTLREKFSSERTPQHRLEMLKAQKSDTTNTRKTTSLCAASHTIPPRCRQLPMDNERSGVCDDASDSENEYEWLPNEEKSENSMPEIMSLLMRAGYDPEQESPKSFLENSDMNPQDLPEACRFM